MNQKLITQLRILRLSKTKPNYADLGRMYDVDWRTVKKYYEGYEGKPNHRKKPSKLDKHLQLITDKLNIKGTTARAVYEFIHDEVDPDLGTYSNFVKYVRTKGLRPKKTSSLRMLKNSGFPRNRHTLPWQMNKTFIIVLIYSFSP